MSEHQCYEFIAVDRPLTAAQIAELRKISTRADISPTRFWNEYNWGDLKAKPGTLVARYFDAFLYYANWGSREFMLRVPASQIDLRKLWPYFRGDHSARLTKVGAHIVVALRIEDEGDHDHEGDCNLASLLPLRGALLQGDMSLAYLMWLYSVQMEEVSPTTTEPPVPAGLRKPSAAVRALCELMYLDDQLLAAAVETSGERKVDTPDLRAWVDSLPAREKNAWLLKAIDNPCLAIGSEMIATFRRNQPAPASKRRTVSAILARAEELRAAQHSRSERKAAAAQSRAHAARERALNALTREGKAAWARLNEFVDDQCYDEAARLVVDLRDAATHSGRIVEFDRQWAESRKQHARCRKFLGIAKRRLEST